MDVPLEGIRWEHLRESPKRAQEALPVATRAVVAQDTCTLLDIEATFVPMAEHPVFPQGLGLLSETKFSKWILVELPWSR